MIGSCPGWGIMWMDHCEQRQITKKTTDPIEWLPAGKRAAVVISVDDVFPAPSAEAALGILEQLQHRHPQCKFTLFTTPDWRAAEPFPSNAGDKIRSVRSGRYRLDRHEALCQKLRNWPGVEIALHGLHHLARGRRTIAEFEGLSRKRCLEILKKAQAIFDSADLGAAPGLCPPAWHATDGLIAAMADLKMEFLASARDLTSPITASAITDGSGLRGLPLVRPARLPNGIVHFPVNFQATSTDLRAASILEHGGLLSIKAHMLSQLGQYTALDGLTSSYIERLDGLFSRFEDTYGDDIWWTTMGEIASEMNTSWR